MKKALLFFLFMAVQTVLFAQERQYVPFVEEGKAWSYTYSHYDSSQPPLKDPMGNLVDCIFTMQGDTEINGKEYKKVYCQFEKYYGDNEQHYYCAVREENDRVYILANEAAEEKLLYDFSSPEEDIVLPFTVGNYKFIRTRGERRADYLPGQLEFQVCHLSGNEIDYSNDTGCWIGGVGTYMGNSFAFESCPLFFDEPQLGVNMFLYSCVKDGQYYFNIDWLAEPMETTTINDRRHTDNTVKESPLFDLQGRRLTSQPTKGLYIRNGRKIVAR